MPRRSPYGPPETEEERQVRILKQVRQLTNLLKGKVPEMLTWEALDEYDIEVIERHLTDLKSVLPKRERVHGDWSECYRLRGLLDQRTSLVGWLATHGQMDTYVPPEDQRKLNAAVETALDALQARQKDDEALSLIVKMSDTHGRTEDEKPQFIAKAKDIEARRRWSGGGAKMQSYFDYLMGKQHDKTTKVPKSGSTEVTNA